MSFFVDNAVHCFKNFANINGRARRKEYWQYLLMCLICMFPIVYCLHAIGFERDEVTLIGSLIHYPLMFSVTVRRLHDTDRSAWWLLLSLIPLIGGLILLFFLVKKGSEGENRFGPDPKSADNSSVSVNAESKLVTRG